MQRASRGWWQGVAILLVTCALFAVSAVAETARSEAEQAAQDEETAATATETTNAEAPALVEGARIYRDPATGFLTPRRPEGVAPPGLSVANQRAISRSSQGLTPRILRGGAVAIDLQGRFQSLSLARQAPDGTLEMSCVHDGEAAQHFLEPNDTATSQPKESRDVR